MTDFHMHVLPGIDDGSKSAEMSVAMLETSAAYGVSTVCATSHFYAHDNSLGRFLHRRAEAFQRLRQAMDGRDDLPEILLGAEVYYFSGMSAMEGLERLCLEGTDLLLLEMPFVRWTDRMLREVQAIRSRGIQPVAAHIERYMHIQDRKTMERFLDMDVLVQCNAEFFHSRRTARHALGMLKRESIHFLGSDAHNMSSRSPDLGEALRLIEKKLGREAVLRLEDNAEFFIRENEGRFS